MLGIPADDRAIIQEQVLNRALSNSYTANVFPFLNEVYRLDR